MKLKIFYFFKLLVEFLTVDFLVPELKTVVECYGNQHFIKYVDLVNWNECTEIENRLNWTTAFKNNCLKMLGYKIIIIDENNFNNFKQNIELTLFEQFEKIKR